MGSAPAARRTAAAVPPSVRRARVRAPRRARVETTLRGLRAGRAPFRAAPRIGLGFRVRFARDMLTSPLRVARAGSAPAVRNLRPRAPAARRQLPAQPRPLAQACDLYRLSARAHSPDPS